MKTTIFYAWQSDRLLEAHRYLIRDALQDALDRLRQAGVGNDDAVAGGAVAIESAPPIDPQDVPELDHDTKGVWGTPNIAETIRDKIRECGAFLADLTFVGTAEGSGGNASGKRLPNPNVLIELGMAAESVGWDRILLVMNVAHGEPPALPFDLRHRRFPVTYKLATDATAAERKAVRKELGDKLYVAVRALIAEGRTRPEAPEAAEVIKGALRAGDAAAVEDAMDAPLRKLKTYLDGFTFDDPVDPAAYLMRVREIDALTTPLVRAAFVAGRRDTAGIAISTVQGAIRAVASWETRSGTYNLAWQHLRSYPATLVLYAGGLGALIARRYEALAELWRTPVSPGLQEAEPAAAQLFSVVALFEPTAKLLPGVERFKLPGSHWVLQRLQAALSDLYPVAVDLPETFDRYELFAAAAALDLDGSPLAGRFVDSLDRMGIHQNLGPLRAELADERAHRLATAAGLFGGSVATFHQRLNQVVQAGQRHNPFLSVQF